MGFYYKLLRSLFLIILILNIIPIILNFFSIEISGFLIYILWVCALLLFCSFLPSSKNLVFSK